MTEGSKSLGASRDPDIVELPDRLELAHDGDADRECESLSFVGTCQWCGGYWDVRFRTVCPCGGEVL